MVYSLDLHLLSACTRTSHIVEVKTVRALKPGLCESPVFEACEKVPTERLPL